MIWFWRKLEKCIGRIGNLKNNILIWKVGYMNSSDGGKTIIVEKWEKIYLNENLWKDLSLLNLFE